MPRGKIEGFVRPHGSGSSITVEVSPGASRTEITGVNPWRGALQIRVAAEAREGAANDELVSFLASKLGVSPGDVRFLKGERSTLKVLTVPLAPGRVESVLRVPE